MLAIWIIIRKSKIIKCRDNVIKNQREKIEDLHKRALLTEGNDILRNVLELSFEKSAITKSTKSICDVLRKYYKISYCTLLLYKRDKLNIISTNIEEQYASYMESHANYLLGNMEDVQARIQCSDVHLIYPTARDRKIKYMNFIPLKFSEKIIGALLIEHASRGELEELGTDLFEIVVDNIAIVLQNFIYYDKLVASAMIDGLTQMYNRAYLEKRINEVIEEHKISNMNFFCALADIDHFKKVNDTYGHLDGDKVLKMVSKYIKEHIRAEEDFIGRYGGEEFAIVFTKASVADIFNRVDNIREGLSKLDIVSDDGRKIPITASFGISQYPLQGNTMKELFKAADQALYYSKENGRNKVTLYEEIKEMVVN
jgi:diguanylate cyclase (GGDEF)-like protein